MRSRATLGGAVERRGRRICFIDSITIGATVSAVLQKLGLGALLGLVTFLQPTSAGAVVQTLVESGVSRLVDNLPNSEDPTLLWTTTPACNTNPDNPFLGMPGDELQPALISRASLSVATPRVIFSFNPPRPVAVCNPYKLLSNVWALGPDLYFVDNQGPDGDAALRRLPRDANPGDAPRMLVDLGAVESASLLVFDTSVILIASSDSGDRIVQYDKDTGQLLNGIGEVADAHSLSNLHFDGHFLYWTDRGSLRRYDTMNGDGATPVNGPIDSLYVYPVDEFCTPDGHFIYSRVIYSEGNALYEAETISGRGRPLVHEPGGERAHHGDHSR